MTDHAGEIAYTPGMYAGRAKKRVTAADLADKCIRQWEDKRQAALKEEKAAGKINYCISFSRKIGVGALEIADLLGEKTGFRVVDREILEYIANNADLNRQTVDFFDECYPGVMNNFGAMLFGEKSFTMADYMRHLLLAVYGLVEEAPTIFVGRAAHLIMPRDRVLAVRLIGSRENRAKRVAGILNIDTTAAMKKIQEEDKRQQEFFRKNFNKKDASPYEFDIIINRDHFEDAGWIADLVAQSYHLKFGK